MFSSSIGRTGLSFQVLRVKGNTFQYLPHYRIHLHCGFILSKYNVKQFGFANTLKYSVLLLSCVFSNCIIVGSLLEVPPAQNFWENCH